MKKFVHKYLDSYYDVKRLDTKSKKIIWYEFDSIVIKNTTEYVYQYNLLKELLNLVLIDKLTLRNWVDEWAIIKIPNINLEAYWETVEPMSAPKDKLSYFDFSYSSDIQLKIKDNIDRIQAGISISASTRNKWRAGELDHPIFISSRAFDKTEEIERQSWFNKKNLDKPK